MRKAGENQNVGKIAIEREGVRLHLGQADRRMCRDRTPFDGSVELFHACQHGLRFNIAGDHENGVVRRVPILVEFSEHGAGGGFKRWPGAERVVRVGGAGEKIFVQACDEFVGRVGKIAGDFLFDGASLGGPLFLGVFDILHTGRIEAQRQFQILSGHGDEVLRDVLLRIGVGTSAQLGIDRGNLIAREPFAAAEGHVFLSMGGAGKACGSVLAANQIIFVDCGDGRERIAHDDDAQTVVEGSSKDAGCRVRCVGRACGNYKYGQQQRNS